MGIGIDVANGTMVKGNQKEKTFIISAELILGNATGAYKERALWVDRPYSKRGEALLLLTDCLNGLHKEVLSDGYPYRTKHFKGTGITRRIEVHMCVTGEVSKHIFVEIAEDGFYLYPSAKDMDEMKDGDAYYTSDAEEAVRIYSSTVEAAADRFETRKHFVDDACREERLTRDRLKRKVKSASNKKKGELKKQLKEAQEALDNKKALVRKTDEYKALLVPGKMENVWTYK